MTPALINAIEIIVNDIPVNLIFDSHYVIQMLFENHSADYKQARRDYETIEAFHSQISIEIGRMSNVNKEQRLSLSLNIHHHASENACWYK